jgi:hypothetical protein
MTLQLPSLRELPKEYRLLAALVMLTLSIGYMHAIGYVYLTTRMAPKGIEERYRGTESSNVAHPSANVSSEEAELASKDTASHPTTVTGEMQYEKSLAEMLNIIHTHVLTMTFIFALSGLITLMTRSIPTGLRRFAIVEPFYGILATFGGIWATRFIHPAFSWLVSVSGALMAFAFLVQCYAVLRELLATPGIRRPGS